MSSLQSAPQTRQHPERRIIGFLAVIALMVALMAATHTWKPRLGLDLRGGTTITLTASDAGNGGAVSKENLQTAANIIAQRVDSLGVGESSVTVQGDRQIEVAVPNMSGDELIDLVGSTARLNFRGVVTYAQVEAPQPTTEPSADPSASPSADPSAAGSALPSAAESTGARRPAPQLPTAPPAPRTPRPTVPASEMPPLADRIAYQPTDQDIEEFMDFQCGDSFPDVADQPLIACDEEGTIKYLLTPVLVSGENLTDASAGIPQGEVKWVVNLELDEQGASDFAAVTKAIALKQQPQNQFAIALDGKVIMAPSVSEEIAGGKAQISGQNIDEKGAKSLASTLRYGALPINMEVDSVDTISPTLGGDQLNAGLIAGGIGLLLVLIYSFIYYRGLSLIVIGSLAAAAAMTYAVMVLLGSAVGFALNLPGIAGAIVAIGVTADSFIVYFERIRDEIRDGHSLRHSIESGWHKARNTILMADGVQLLAAIVLYILAIGSVKGFAFTLGITTLMDLFLVVYFTKPLMTILGRTKFFGEGHKWSGFDPEHLGVSREQILGRRYSSRSTKRTTKVRDKHSADAAASTSASASKEGSDNE